MTFAVNKKRAAAYNQVLNDLAMRVFGREPDDAINEGTCLGCNAVVDVDTKPIGYLKMLQTTLSVLIKRSIGRHERISYV